MLSATDVAHGSLPVEISMEPIIEGAPFAYERVLVDDDGAFFAVWECDAGVYPRVKDRRGSFMYILSGDADIVDDLDGTVHHLVADTIILLPFGWSGRWVIRETIRKVYLHTEPAAPFRPGLQPSAFFDVEQTLRSPLTEQSVLGGPSGHELLVFDGPDGHCAVADAEVGLTTVAAAAVGRFVHVIAGTGAIIDKDGTERAFEAGGAFALPGGWSGSWRVDLAARFMYVRTPERADG